MQFIYLEKNGKKQRLFNKFKVMGALSRFVGLMFQPKATTPLLFTGNGRIAIHSYFCPLFDAVFLNKDKTVITAVTVPPKKHVAGDKNAFFLLELPVGSISKFTIKKGDKLTWTMK